MNINWFKDEENAGYCKKAEIPRRPAPSPGGAVLARKAAAFRAGTTAEG